MEIQDCLSISHQDFFQQLLFRLNLEINPYHKFYWGSTLEIFPLQKWKFNINPNYSFFNFCIGSWFWLMDHGLLDYSKKQNVLFEIGDGSTQADEHQRLAFSSPWLPKVLDCHIKSFKPPLCKTLPRADLDKYFKKDFFFFETLVPLECSLLGAALIT